MENKEVKQNTKRITFSKEVKKKVLIEFSKGKNSDKIFSDILKIDTKTISKDKKYASKLIHKWKNELYKSKEKLNENIDVLSDESIIERINNIKDDDYDEIYIEIKKMYKTNQNFTKFKRKKWNNI